MGFKDLQRKLKEFSVTQFLKRNVERRNVEKRNVESSKRKAAEKYSWMTPITHGFHVIEDRSLRGRSDLDSDSVVVQREQIQDREVWMFGIFDPQMEDGVTKYLQSHLLDKKLDEIRKKSKETMKKAYLSAKSREGEKKNERTRKGGSTFAIVINGEKVVASYMADYRAIICRDGVANQIGKRYKNRSKRNWPLNLGAGARHMPKVRILGSETGSKPSTSEPVVGVEKIDSDAEFLILASDGIWEVMNNQEAVDLIRHIDDPQEAAECLAEEALARMSRSSISCLVIRFD